jgi:hypothetical protein
VLYRQLLLHLLRMLPLPLLYAGCASTLPHGSLRLVRLHRSHRLSRPNRGHRLAKPHRSHRLAEPYRSNRRFRKHRCYRELKRNPAGVYRRDTYFYL